MSLGLHIRNKWFVHLTTLLVMIGFVTLGIWQLGRGNFKMQVHNTIEQQSAATALTVKLPLEDPSQWRYKKIKLVGRYASEKQFLLDNQVRNQAVGYYVLSAFFVEDMQTWVLVDRGWIAQGNSRKQLPEISLPTETSSNIEISGSIYVPYAKAFSLGGIAEGEDQGWPRRIQFVDYAELGKRLGVELQAFTLRLDPDQANGYARDWVSNQLPASKHYGYAFQWFAMATAVLILWWVYYLRPKLKSQREGE